MEWNDECTLLKLTRVAGADKIRNEKLGNWGNRKEIHCILFNKLLTFCYCSHQRKVTGSCQTKCKSFL